MILPHTDILGLDTHLHPLLILRHMHLVQLLETPHATHQKMVLLRTNNIIPNIAWVVDAVVCLVLGFENDVAVWAQEAFLLAGVVVDHELAGV